MFGPRWAERSKRCRRFFGPCFRRPGTWSILPQETDPDRLRLNFATPRDSALCHEHHQPFSLCFQRIFQKDVSRSPGLGFLVAEKTQTSLSQTPGISSQTPETQGTEHENRVVLGHELGPLHPPGAFGSERCSPEQPSPTLSWGSTAGGLGGSRHESQSLRNMS